MEEKKAKVKHSFRSFSCIRNISKFFLLPRYNSKNLGFTLVELLVVVGLIGVLAASLILIINPVTQLQKARDSKIKSNISQIQSALEIYRADCGNYPTPSGNLVPSPLTSSCAGTPITYLQTIPTFPASAQFRYTNPGGVQFYRMEACLERNDTSEGTTLLATCPTSHDRAVVATSP